MRLFGAWDIDLSCSDNWEKIIDIENSNVNVGNPKNLINLISSEDIILLNGVEFKQLDVATETTNGTSKIATQTEVDNGLEDTKIVTSKKLKELFANGLNTATNGYQKLPGGLILQWGGGYGLLVILINAKQ